MWQPKQPLSEAGSTPNHGASRRQTPAFERHDQRIARGPQSGNTSAVPPNIEGHQIDRVIPSNQAFNPSGIDGPEGRRNSVEQRKHYVGTPRKGEARELMLSSHDTHRRAEPTRDTRDVEINPSAAWNGKQAWIVLNHRIHRLDAVERHFIADLAPAKAGHVAKGYRTARAVDCV